MSDSGPINNTLAQDDFSPEFFSLLQQGVEVPLRVRTPSGQAEEAGRAKVRYFDGRLILEQAILKQGSLISEYQKLWQQQYGRPIPYQQCEVSDSFQAPEHGEATPFNLCFNIRTFELSVTLPATAFEQNARSRVVTLPDSTEQHLSGLFNYNATFSRNDSQQADGYLRLQSLSAYGSTHLYLDGDARTRAAGDIYEARLERDIQGVKITGGYLGSWGLNQIGNVSYIQGGKFYGVSAGNMGRSQSMDNSLSRSPIFVFMPASGQVNVYRENKLIHVQTLPIGNHEVDTSPFPVGNYPVRLEVVVNGEVVSKQNEMVHKTASYRKGKDQAFQVFGGIYQAAANNGNTHLFGATGQWNTRWADISATVYHYDDLLAFEPTLSWQFAYGSITSQMGVASNRSYNSTLSGSVNLGPVNIWSSYDNSRRYDQPQLASSVEDRKTIRRYLSAGGSLDLQRLLNSHRYSNLNLSLGQDHISGNRDLRLDFGQTLFQNKLLELKLNAGKTWSRRNDTPNEQSFYASLNLTLSFGSAGLDYSRTRDSESMGIKASWQPKNITGLDYLGGNMGNSRSLKHSAETSHDSGTGNSHSYFNLNGNGKTSHFSWDASAGKNSNHGGFYFNGSLSGSMAWNHAGLGWGHAQSEAGMIVKLDQSAAGQLELLVNQRPSSLFGRSTFVAMPAFSQADVQLRNSPKSPANFEIQQAERHLVLYPGNIAAMQPRLRQLVTVFGVLVENGRPRSGVVLRNHIGEATTAEDGSFVIDVDKTQPSLEYQMADSSQCQLELNLSQAQGAAWVNQVSCSRPTIS
ncbi:TcfC E-set like domain-containing protein [Chromobacterium haemolyticum]